MRRIRDTEGGILVGDGGVFAASGGVLAVNGGVLSGSGGVVSVKSGVLVGSIIDRVVVEMVKRWVRCLGYGDVCVVNDTVLIR
jgi:hypothetical protein